MATSFTRKFTIGPGSKMAKTALETILQDIETRNANGRHVVSHELVDDDTVLALTYEAVDDDE